MPAAVKVPGKGTILKITIATVLTAVAQVKEIGAPDAEVEDYDSTALDTGVGKGHDVTGYTEGGKVSFSGWFDPAHASHKAFTALLAAPAKVVFNIVFADAGATVWPFTAIVKKFTPKVALGEGLTFDAELQLDGLCTYP